MSRWDAELAGTLGLESPWTMDRFRRERVRLTSGDDIYRAANNGEHVFGGPGNDGIIGGNGADRLHGNGGDDGLKGGKGADRLDGGTGNDHLDGGRGPDVLIGGNGNDSLNADGGADLIIPGSGYDIIAVNDIEADGARDVVAFQSIAEGEDGASEDSIYFFAVGEDKFDFSAIDADPSTPEDDAFHIVPIDDVSGQTGELWFTRDHVGAIVVENGVRQQIVIHIWGFASGHDGVLTGSDFVL